ncbi:MAG: hypothetical protein QXP31_02265 [Pyrobaculum sp.]
MGSEPSKKYVTAVELAEDGTALSDGYLLIAEALMQVKRDSPRAWRTAHVELTKPAKIVEEAPQYNKKPPQQPW